MKAKDIQLGGTYAARVSGRVAPVKITTLPTPDRTGYGGTNLTTGRDIRMRSAARLRYPCNPDGSPKREPCYRCNAPSVGRLKSETRLAAPGGSYVCPACYKALRADTGALTDLRRAQGPVNPTPHCACANTDHRLLDAVVGPCLCLCHLPRVKANP